jgi:hypothetical protein
MRASTRPHALYEWNYPRQMLSIRQAGDEYVNIYSDEFLISRPMLEALRHPRDTVLLIDEIDRADHEFEAFLLEFLSDFSISIPERGTIRAQEHPVVVLTSNRTRELHEALRRRCVYHWIDYPASAARGRDRDDAGELHCRRHRRRVVARLAHCAPSRWPNPQASPRRSSGQRPRRCSTSRGRPGRPPSAAPLASR